MKKYHIGVVGFAVLLLTIIGCNKYLDVQPKGYILLTTVQEYDQWLNDPVLTTDGTVSGITPMQDNRDYINFVPGTTQPGDLAYLWVAQFTTDATQTPPVWTPAYSYIYKYNTVINGVKKASGGSQDQIMALYSEALAGRAYTYLWLVNLYGKYYDSATAGTDLSVPFITTNDISSTVPPRSTVQNFYKQILSDLNAALPYLKASNASDRMRISVSACYSILARAYYYMGNWAQAQKSAEEALSNDPSLAMVDYNTIPDPSKFAATRLSPDNIYFRTTTTTTTTTLTYTSTVPPTPTLAFLRSFDTADLRLKLFYANIVNGVYSPVNGVFDTRGKVNFTNYGTLRTNSNSFFINTGTSVAEMKLIIAESAARQGDLSTALEQLHEVRKDRIAASSYHEYTSDNKDSVIQHILSERSFEFAFNGLRWLDMRKLDHEGLMPAVNRYNDAGTVIATLAPNDNRYTLQIPSNVLFYNPGMPQNP